MKNCPRCRKSQIQKIGNTFICKCGWTYSRKKDFSQTPIVIGMILFFVFVSVSLFHFFQWGSYGFNVLFAGEDKKLKICMDLKKYDCVETHYKKLFESTGDSQFLQDLGELQFKRKKFKESAKTYRLYFLNKGNSYKSAYYYAHSLAKIGDIESSIKYFDSILKSKPQTLMVNIIESYLQILVSYDRIAKAKEILTWAYEVSRGSMNTETQIENWKQRFNI